MSDELTQTDADNLADVIWWIKGFRSAEESTGAICAFGADHIESLRKFRVAYQTKNKVVENRGIPLP